MSNGLMTLDFEGQPIRTAGTLDEPQWIAADVCRILGIRNVSDVLSDFLDTEKGIVVTDTPQGSQEMLTVTEPGLYRLILQRRRRPEVERFRIWVTHEVLPSIRRFGSYPPPEITSHGTALVRIDEEALGRAIGKELHSAIVPRLDSLDERVDNLTTAVNSLQRRAELTESVKRFHVQVVHRMFDGRCPCCSFERIVNEHGERLECLQFDHWHLRTQNGIGHTWPVCVTCNQRLRDADFHTECEVHFKSYQARRRHLEFIMSPERRQGKLGFMQ